MRRTPAYGTATEHETMAGLSNPQEPPHSDPEVIEVEVERLGVPPTRGQKIRRRLFDTLVPIVVAVAIDTGDLGLGLVPIGRPLALPVGLLAGYVFSGYLRVAPTWRVILTCVVGLYFALPFTGPIPLATILAAGVQLFDPDRFKREPF
ncbi:MAG: hypothetical protein AAGB93_07615 [Planctomycetota bacterium]